MDCMADASFPILAKGNFYSYHLRNQVTLPETNIAHENPIFPGKYHQNCGFSMAMLVSGSVCTMKRGGDVAIQAMHYFFSFKIQHAIKSSRWVYTHFPSKIS